MQTDKGAISWIERWPLSYNSVDRIRPIENNNGNIILLAGAQAEKHCPDKSIVTGANILEIDQKRVEVLEHRRRRFAMFAVKTVDRNPESRMFVALPLDHIVLGLAEIAVLRAEEGMKTKEFAIRAFENFRCVLEAGRDGGRMKQCSQSSAAQFFRP